MDAKKLNMMNSSITLKEKKEKQTRRHPKQFGFEGI